MNAARVRLVLSVWERADASLPACTQALEANGWDVAAARAALAPRRVAALPQGSRSAAQLLSRYKELARGYKDVAAGTFPRSLLWVTEHATGTPQLLFGWERHRYFLGAPMTRWLVDGSPAAPRRSAGVARLARLEPLERSAAQPCGLTTEQEAGLALCDARFIRDRLQSFASSSGMRVAVELFGRAGFLDADGGDGELMKAFAALEARAVELENVDALLDAHPDRRRDVVDCGWAAQWETSLARTAHLLVLVDLFSEPASPAQRTLAAIEEAVAEHVYLLALHRFRYVHASIDDVTDLLDRMAVERGAQPNASAWRELTREAAHATIVEMLTTSLAYRRSVLPNAADAATHAAAFLSTFQPGARYYTNRHDSHWTPILPTTFEQGIAVVDDTHVGMFYVGDED